MHSGINLYIPRGLKSLDRRITNKQMEGLKIERVHLKIEKLSEEE